MMKLGFYIKSLIGKSELLLLLLFCTSSIVQAQDMLTIRGTVILMGSSSSEDIKRVSVYSFAGEKEASAAFELLKKRDASLLDKALRRVRMQDNDFTIGVPNNGYLIIRSSDLDYDPVMQQVDVNSAYITIDLYKHGVQSEEKTEDLGKKGTVIKEAKYLGAKRRMVTETQEEDGLLISEISADVPFKATSNMRLVAQPLWIDRVNLTDEDGDTIFAFGKHAFRDMPQYAFTQKRRMNFDLQRNDSLYRYSGSRERNIEAITLERPDTVHIHLVDTLWGYDPDESHPYPFGFIFVAQDYNSILHKDTILDNGERRNPLKFLDFSFREFLPNPSFFEERMADRELTVRQDLNLHFMVGQATLNQEDAFNTRQLELLREEMEKAGSGHALLDGIDIYGVASPEGSVASNEELALRRARTAQSLVLGMTRNIVGKNIEVNIKDSKVAPWKAVADSLQRDGHSAEAEAVYRILEECPVDMQQQGARIARLDCYSSLIKETYLPKLRTVRYDMHILEQRQLSQGEVLDYYHAGRKDELGRPELWTLFQYKELWDNPKEMEDVCRFALQKYDNPQWAYPACILACCYIARDTADLNLLTPFLDLKADSAGSVSEPYYRKDANGVNIIKYINYPEVAANQMIMILRQSRRNDRRMLPVLETLIKGGGEPYDTLLAFSQCYRGGYKEKPGKFTAAEATRVRSIVSGTSVTNAVVLDLAMDDEAYLKDAISKMDELPRDRAASDYLKAIIYMRWEQKNDSSAYYLAQSFVKDIRMIPTAGNDKDLISENDIKITALAFPLWKEEMNRRSRIVPAGMNVDTIAIARIETLPQDEKQAFTWFYRAQNILANQQPDYNTAKEYLFKCFDIDKRYLPVVSVAAKVDALYNKRSQQATWIKEIRKEYTKTRR